MGERLDKAQWSADEQRRFTRELLQDLLALERMIDNGWIEADPLRLGAEQEAFLVDGSWQPAPVALETLETLNDERATTELARFNIEFNIPPLALHGGCFSQLEREVSEVVAKAGEAAARHGARIVLTGILPTITPAQLTLDYMTPRPRYHAMNEAMTRLRGQHYEVRIKGQDELLMHHDNVMLEACNTSFQVHLQVPAEHFAERYNAAQLVAAPVLAAAVNAPLLFDRRLWAETRIALFQQSTDTRSPRVFDIRRQPARVSFGTRWVDRSVTEIFHEDVARFKVILGASAGVSSMELVQEGKVPRLESLCRHNGTVYRWNRPCYGLSEGRPHLRIENRYLPSGPTIVDEIANAAFWIGLLQAVPVHYGDLRYKLPFERVRANFLTAARVGLEAQVVWLGGGTVPVHELILDELLPLARQGLLASGIDEADAKSYLQIIEDRVATGRTGSRWLATAYRANRHQGTVANRMADLVRAIYMRQQNNEPVHRWSAPTQRTMHRSHYERIGQLMSTDLFTIKADELVDLAVHVMNWRHIRHIPVEDDRHRLVGLVSHRALLRFFARRCAEGGPTISTVREMMETDVVTVTPETSTREALARMRRRKVGCLPVVDENERLVGIVTERDFITISEPLLDDFLAGTEDTSCSTESS